MDNIRIRALRADEIECRIGTISEKGLSLLLYKDARAGRESRYAYSRRNLRLSRLETHPSEH